MTFFNHLPRIETLNLSQKFRKIFAKFLVLKLVYLLYFIRRLIDKIKLLIKR